MEPLVYNTAQMYPSYPNALEAKLFVACVKRGMCALADEPRSSSQGEAWRSILLQSDPEPARCHNMVEQNNDDQIFADAEEYRCPFQANVVMNPLEHDLSLVPYITIDHSEGNT